MTMQLNGEEVANVFIEHGVRDERTGEITYIAEDKADAGSEAELALIVSMRPHRVVQRTVFETEWTISTREA